MTKKDQKIIQVLGKIGEVKDLEEEYGLKINIVKSSKENDTRLNMKAFIFQFVMYEKWTQVNTSKMTKIGRYI